MKTTLPERSMLIKRRLKAVVDLIVAVSEDKIAKIILYGSYARGTWVNDICIEGRMTYSYQSDLDILILLKKNKSSLSHILRLENRIEKHLEKTELDGSHFMPLASKPPVSLIIEPIGRVNKLLEEGRYFFSDIKKEGIILYDNGEYELSEKRDLTDKEKGLIAKDEYDYWSNRGIGFFIDSGESGNAYNRKDYSLCAFYLHQVTESFYNAISLVFSAYKPKTHDIKKLEIRVKNYHNDLLKIFPKDTPERKQCFQLLRSAYTEARYNKNYSISKEQLDYLTHRIEKLKKVTEKICLREIKRLGS